MGCLFSFLWSNKLHVQEPLKTEAIYSLIFKDAYKSEKNYDKSFSDSEVSYTYDKGDLIQ